MSEFKGLPNIILFAIGSELLKTVKERVILFVKVVCLFFIHINTINKFKILIFIMSEVTNHEIEIGINQTPGPKKNECKIGYIEKLKIFFEYDEITGNPKAYEGFKEYDYD